MQLEGSPHSQTSAAGASLQMTQIQHNENSYLMVQKEQMQLNRSERYSSPICLLLLLTMRCAVVQAMFDRYCQPQASVISHMRLPLQTVNYAHRSRRPRRWTTSWRGTTRASSPTARHAPPRHNPRPLLGHACQTRSPASPSPKHRRARAAAEAGSGTTRALFGHTMAAAAPSSSAQPS